MLDDNIINNIISQSITALNFCVEPKCSLVEAYHNILQIKKEIRFFLNQEEKKKKVLENDLSHLQRQQFVNLWIFFFLKKKISLRENRKYGNSHKITSKKTYMFW